MKKLIGIIAVFLLAVGLLAGCESKKDTSVTETTGSQTETQGESGTTASGSDGEGLVVEETGSADSANDEVGTAEGDSHDEVVKADPAQKGSVETAAGGIAVIDETELIVYVDSALEEAFEKGIVTTYNISQPKVKIEVKSDSTAKLLKKIKKGTECDLFFYKDSSKMDDFEKKDFVKKGTSVELLDSPLYTLALLAHGDEKDIQTIAANDFFEFLLSEEAMSIFADYGFSEHVNE
jgi:ABC-type molybdate transport system substrate-binding protein